MSMLSKTPINSFGMFQDSLEVSPDNKVDLGNGNSFVVVWQRNGDPIQGSKNVLKGTVPLTTPTIKPSADTVHPAQHSNNLNNQEKDALFKKFFSGGVTFGGELKGEVGGIINTATDHMVKDAGGAALHTAGDTVSSAFDLFNKVAGTGEYKPQHSEHHGNGHVDHHENVNGEHHEAPSEHHEKHMPQHPVESHHFNPHANAAAKTQMIEVNTALSLQALYSGVFNAHGELNAYHEHEMHHAHQEKELEEKKMKMESIVAQGTGKKGPNLHIDHKEGDSVVGSNTNGGQG